VTGPVGVARSIPGGDDLPGARCAQASSDGDHPRLTGFAASLPASGERCGRLPVTSTAAHQGSPGSRKRPTVAPTPGVRLGALSQIWRPSRHTNSLAKGTVLAPRTVSPSDSAPTAAMPAQRSAVDPRSGSVGVGWSRHRGGHLRRGSVDRGFSRLLSEIFDLPGG